MNTRLLLLAAATTLLLSGARLTPLQADFPPLQLKPVAVGQFFSPTAVTHAADGSGRLFIADQRGKIHVLFEGVILPQPFLDIGEKLVPERPGFDERGLLGLTFHPDFATAGTDGEGLFYVYYSAPSPDSPGSTSNPVDHQSVIAEYRVSETDPDVADLASERILLTFNQPQFNHNGGQLAFGPEDAMLYISTGDGGSSNDNNAGHTGGDSSQPSGVLGNAQDRTKLLGKLLRIDPFGDNGPGGEYGVPEDNPFVDEEGGIREEIFAYGLRNPWRFSFDDGPGGTNRLFLPDVGQGSYEEINIGAAGGNYGWRRFEGFEDFDATTPSSGPYIDPVAAYTRPGQGGDTDLLEIGISVTGGYVYRGSEIPELQGKYVFGDWSTGFGTPDGTLLGLEETSPDVFEISILEIEGGNPIGRFIPAFGVDEDGEIYVATKTTLAPSDPEPDSGDPSGQLFKLVGAPDPVETSLVAARDNSIYSDFQENSNGTGSLFAGMIASEAGVRRALVRFDVDSIPSDAEVLSASLSLTVHKTVTGAFDFSLHRLTSDWGEAGSNGIGTGAPAEPGDATWLKTFFDTDDWDTAGGDFEADASATASVGGIGTYTWSSDPLGADVQQWIDQTTNNYGWILLGNEDTPSAKAIHSRESTNESLRPTLNVTYRPSEFTLTRRETWEQQFFHVGQFIDYAADFEGDAIPVLLEYAWDLDPFAQNTFGDHFDVEFGNEDATVTFRRDPRATDLTYSLEVSTDLLNWTPVVTSTDGDTATGGAFVSESTDPAHPETRLVEASFPLNVPKRFVRLNVRRP